MANGDAAAAAGMDVISAATGLVKNGADEINKTRDYIAAGKAASSITSGTFDTARIPTLDASKIGTGTLAAARIPTLTAAQVPSLDASKIGTGTLAAARIPTLDASKIGTGTLDGARIPDSLPGKAVDRTNGPTATAYNRTAQGSGWYSAYMNSDLEFMRNTSSRRYKDDEQPAVLDVAAILALQPVTYHRIGQPDGTRELGLIAEDCVDVPHLVQWDVPRNKDGQPRAGGKERPESVRYEQVLPVMLLEVCRAQQAQIDALLARVAQLETTTKEEA
ncbi:tail fiber domain-containing protein [Demequina capsici]|uniref:Tail fiber domain-containing protein n=1 Tax=Demequina capsici TaxID=3075620 RepID=A0AA96F9E4_9MICO|nr:tail fiber domain-containing protein [Demequina sp. OYTSA14]WNM25247.1 tail fiber domain-containing protein [Demequina sp. OYTSA14]